MSLLLLLEEDEVRLLIDTLESATDRGPPGCEYKSDEISRLAAKIESYFYDHPFLVGVAPK
jgi:hypothetical protein